MSRCFLGIDVGTTGAKALLLDDIGTVLGNVTTEYPLSTPKPLWSEQNPENWWQATVASIGRALKEADRTPSDIAAVGLTGQMHGLVALDRNDHVLRPAILWNDQRTSAQCDAMHEIIGRERLIELTGKPALTGFTAPKIIWLREHEPEIYAQIARVLLPKDYVRFRLTGAKQCDVADASGTSLFDVKKRAWSDELIGAFDIPRNWLPEVFESPVACAEVADGHEDILAAGTPVVAGAGDQAAEAVGCGVVRDNAIAVTIGTSGVVFIATDEPRFDSDGRLHGYCHALPSRWHLMGVMLSAGGSLRWWRDTIGDSYEQLTQHARQAPAGCERLTFLPYLTGERTPHADPHARGAFLGLTLRHDKSHMTRAVMEGITFGLRDAIELARQLGVDVSRVRISGGGAISEFWRQMAADAFNCDVVTVNVTQGAAYGAAILAAVGAGAFASVEEATDRVVREMQPTRPDGATVPAYEEAYERYKAAYPALREWFRK